VAASIGWNVIGCLSVGSTASIKPLKKKALGGLSLVLAVAPGVVVRHYTPASGE
jgi:hypothetical protein